MDSIELDAIRDAARHAWRYGSTEDWARYSARLAQGLVKAGVPDVQRQKRIWYDNPATAQWEVSFPERYLAIATRVGDGLYFPGELARIRANDLVMRKSSETRRIGLAA
ncbi:hypothetical protein [uncultured Paludibaculum sp.]|uniref:hypothetical protein n=1 Tax=uncultured Paludibaculum sp. TaxID=1765020 RepID=UPI002AAB2286|nr:hypothetical protein [uncultured Paludibaculum sp.]